MLELHLPNVREFLRSILPTEPHFAPGGWYFRGQGDRAWGLIPSIRRARAWDALGGAERHGLSVRGDLVSAPEAELAAKEREMLAVLVQAIERLGLPSDLRSEDALLAFAQHIGLPTRLLDFTYSPMMAAYFAASDAVRLGGDGRLVVYAASLRYVDESHWLRHVMRLTVPGFGNPNLVAQHAVLFKVAGESLDLLSGLPCREIQQGASVGGLRADPGAEVRGPAEVRGSEVDIDSQLLAITLPWSEAARLLTVLRAQGIHAGTVFPGNAGVAELVREVLRTGSFEYR